VGFHLKPKVIYLTLVIVIVLVALWAIFRPETLLIDKQVDEPAPQTTTTTPQTNVPPKDTVLSTGKFRSGEHETEGVATVQQTVNGKKILRLSDFRTDNGPDVHVMLVPNDQVTKSSDVKVEEAVDLGLIKGNIGNQNYEIPANVDVSQYHAVTIWCKRFAVNFGAASLQ
jgi:hypothetical protein